MRVYSNSIEALAAEPRERGDKAIWAEGEGGIRAAFGDEDELPESEFGWYEISLTELDRYAQNDAFYARGGKGS